MSSHPPQATFVSAYERLRASVLEGATGGGHSGLCILLREGTAAWMEHTPTPTEASAVATHTNERPPAPRLVLDGLHADIVDVLASMLCAGQAEASSCP